MEPLSKKKVLVVGLGVSGRAASRLLVEHKAVVTAVDSKEASDPALDKALKELGVEIRRNVTTYPDEAWDLVVLSPGVDPSGDFASAIPKGVPVIGELELAFRLAHCLNLAVTGTNGKTTVTEMITHVLQGSLRKVEAAGNIGRPYSEVIPRTRDLDFTVLEVSSFQLETIQYFRPVVAVLTNISPDHMDRHGNRLDYALVKSKMFKNQQVFDWAVVQSEALAYLMTQGVEIRSKLITFSARNRNADLYLDRGMIISRIPDWSGPVLDVKEWGFHGLHQAENLMATIAVGRILRVPLEEMLDSIRSFKVPPHRCELILEKNGVRYVNDSKSTNADSLAKALESMPSQRAGEPNVWLIAGGSDKGLEYHDLGPLIARRVKGAFLLGENRAQLQCSWSLFTSCYLVDSLKEAVERSHLSATEGDVVLLSPASSSFDMFTGYKDRGDQFRQLVEKLP